MLAGKLSHGSVALVAPNVERDAGVSVDWINGASGAKTMQLMGNPANEISMTTL